VPTPLRPLKRESKPSPFVFASERGTPFMTAGFARIIERAARRGLGLEFEGPSAHASPYLRLCSRQQGTRNAGDSEMVKGIDRSRARRSTRPWRRIGSGISGGSESSDYFLTNGFASISGGHGRSWWAFAKVQAIGKMAWMAGTAPGVNGIEIEIARRFVSLWKSSRDKFRECFAERIEGQPHSARSRDRWYVASRWEFEAHRHESLGII